MAEDRNTPKKPLAAAAALAPVGAELSRTDTLEEPGVRSKAASKLRKGLLTLLLVGGLSAAAGLGTFSAFSATTTNSGNSISSGTVKIDQHTGATSLYVATNKAPGQAVTGCVRVTYGGFLSPPPPKLYPSSGVTN